MKILLLDTNHPFLKTGLESLGHTCDEDYTNSKSAIERKIKNYQGIVIRSRFGIDKRFIDAASNLKFIARVGAGLENINCAYAIKKNIKLISAPEGNMNAVGEHALGMLLGLMNHLNRVDKEVRQGIWLRAENRGTELEGKTVGIIGYGHMGKSFAKKLRGFDVNIICYDILPNKGDSYVTQVTLNKILGACLDVLEYEKNSFESLFSAELPKPMKYLIQSEKVVLSPHIAGWTHESNYKLAKTIVEKIALNFR